MLFDLLYFYYPLFTLLVRWRKYTATFKVKKKYFMTHFYQWKVTMTSKCNDIDTYCYLFYIFPTLCYFDRLSFEKSKRCIYLNNKLLSFVIHMGIYEGLPGFMYIKQSAIIATFVVHMNHERTILLFIFTYFFQLLN